ncbi:olfactory receptor 6M1-like [Spea bombifrons]|uniref:olfactory receptor 6M1-like n=1 Tax=Spea bombifrons TaxID=233779 RepID=UPI00234AD247|nr:olfactory receptor 6M1-like [Spea bombifrons]
MVNFNLTAFPLIYAHRVTSAFFFLLTYFISLSGNLLIILLILKSPFLQTPMYFFLINLSFLEMMFTTTLIPKLFAILAFENHTISLNGCLTQCYFYFFLGSVELLLLAVMSFDRYIAICYPLRYATIMSTGLCLKLAIGCWIGGFVLTIVQTILVCKIKFCQSNLIDHFFCDIEPLLKLACSDTKFIQFVNMLSSSVVVFGSITCIIISYSQIIIAIRSISTITNRWKSFSTCASHLILIFIVYGSSLFLCMRTVTTNFIDFSKLSALLTGIVTPLLNPFIYTLRNHQVKKALKQLLCA